MPMLDYTLPAPGSGGELVLTERQLLQSVVEIARHAFHAVASSVFLIDAANGELVFEAVAGEGTDTLPGARLPGNSGIAGWVTKSGQPMLVDSLRDNDLFDREAAISTGYVPENIMAVPLLRDGSCIGVLEVLDADLALRGELTDLDLLTLFSTLAANSLDLLVRARKSAAFRGLSDEQGSQLLRISEGLSRANNSATTFVGQLLSTAEQYLLQMNHGD